MIRDRNISINLNKLIDKKNNLERLLKSNKKPLINEVISFPFDLKAEIIDILQIITQILFLLNLIANLINLKNN